MVVSSLFFIPVLNAGNQGDVGLYQSIADDLFNGKLPYRDRTVEYPPYAILIFLLPRIFGEDNYLDGFMAFAFVADWLVKLLLFFIGLRRSNTVKALVPLLFYCVAIPFLRFLFLQRYDIFPALICVASVWLYCSNRNYLCGLAIAVGIGVKLYPAVFVPPLFVLSMRQHKGRQFMAGLALGLLPMALLSVFLPWWRFAEFQAARGLQVESLYASVLWLGKLLGLNAAKWEYVRSWFEVGGPAASAVLPWARMMFIGALGISTIVAVWAGAKIPESRGNRHEETRSLKSEIRDRRSEIDQRLLTSSPMLCRLLLLPLLAFIAFNQVLSPQYMIWLLPLATLTSLGGNLTPALMIVIATMLTPIIFPSLHGDYGSGLDLFETSVLLARNLMLVVTWGWLVWRLWQDSRQRTGSQFVL